MRSSIRAGYWSSLVVVIILAGCSADHDPDPANMQRPHLEISSAADVDIEGFEQERQEVLVELKQLREDINNELKRYQERSITTNMDLKEQEVNQQIIKDLQQQRTLMDRQIEKVERAAANEWKDLRSNSRSAAEHARSFDAQLKASEPVVAIDLEPAEN